MSVSLRSHLMRHAWSVLVFALVTPAFAGPMETVRNVPYYTGPDADPYRNRLDLYLPANAAKCPVVVFVHGGGWVIGSKDGFVPGMKPAEMGQFFADHGIVSVFINYRLSPKVKHPEHVTDVARAIAWVRRNVARYGGDSDQIYLM